MDTYKTHGAFSWSELMTNDPQAAANFYSQLFGWKVDTMPMGEGQYRVLKVGETSVGGVMGMPPGAPPMPPVWGCYVTVDNVDETVALAVKLGGKVCVPVMEVPGVGRMAVIADAQGAMLSVMTYNMS